MRRFFLFSKFNTNYSKSPESSDDPNFTVVSPKIDASLLCDIYIKQRKTPTFKFLTIVWLLL